MSWGEIYNTSWWGVALDTARTVKARPDFFGSQLNLLTSEQPNLITNGTFDTDSGWGGVGSNGFSISGGKLNLLDVAYVQNVTQGNVTTVGKIYKVTFEISNYVKGKVRIFLGGSVTPTQTSNGVFTSYVTASSNANVGIQTIDGSGTTLSIDNVSVQVARAELDQIEAKKCLADWIHTTALKDLNN